MADRPRVYLFCEDRGHEQFGGSLVVRLARELNSKLNLQVLSARGGHARALEQFKLWQRSYSGRAELDSPDLLILIIDANCSNWNQARQQLEEAIDDSIVPRSIVGCPDPHVEHWYLADPQSFERVIGARPRKDPDKCERQVYKRLVEEATQRAEVPLLTGVEDLAPDLVEGMDLFRAGKNQPSLRHFVDEVKRALSQLIGS